MYFCYIDSLFCHENNITSLSFTDKLHNPSIVSLHIHDTYNGDLDPHDLERTVYHHMERRSPLNPAKKASVSLEKKFPPKDTVMLIAHKAKSDIKNLTADSNNTMTYNSTVLSSSTVETHIESDAQNVSTTSVPVSNTTVTSNMTSTSTSTVVPVSSSTSSSTIAPITSSVTTSPFSDVLPTKPSNITNTTVSLFKILD